MPNPPPETKPARLLSVVIPARDEEGSTDSTWQILQGEAAKIPALEQSLDHCPCAPIPAISPSARWNSASCINISPFTFHLPYFSTCRYF